MYAQLWSLFLCCIISCHTDQGKNVIRFRFKVHKFAAEHESVDP